VLGDGKQGHGVWGRGDVHYACYYEGVVFGDVEGAVIAGVGVYLPRAMDGVTVCEEYGDGGDVADDASGASPFDESMLSQI
jgi:hypothetical protein